MARTRSQALALTIATTFQTRSRTRALRSAAIFSSLRPAIRAAARPPIWATKVAKRSRSRQRAPKSRSAVRNSASPNLSNNLSYNSAEGFPPSSETATQQQQPPSPLLSSSAQFTTPASSPGHLSSPASSIDQPIQPTFNFGLGQTLPARRIDDDTCLRTLAGWRFLGHQKAKGVVELHHGPDFQAPRRIIDTHRDLAIALANAVKPNYKLQRKEEQYFRIKHNSMYWLRGRTMVKKWDEGVKKNRRILATRNRARKLGCGMEMWKVCQVEQSSGLGVEVVRLDPEVELIDPALRNL